MSPEVFRIVQELKREPFSAIKDVEKFAELIARTYGIHQDEVIQEFRKMFLWMDANPTKAPKKRFKKFIVGWLCRSRWA